MTHESTLRIGVLLPEVLGTYGDTGNAMILAERARRRGIAAEVRSIGIDDEIPSDLDIYTLGGGEDTAQAIASQKCQRDPGFLRAVERGATVLAICASLQILGHWFVDTQGRKVGGLGMLDVTTESQGKRSIGELITMPTALGLTQRLSGFENHGGGTTLGPDAEPLGTVLLGDGNIRGAGVDGVVQGSIVATYMHGPVLARNPELADTLIHRATGIDLEPLEVPGVERLRRERLAMLDR